MFKTNLKKRRVFFLIFFCLSLFFVLTETSLAAGENPLAGKASLSWQANTEPNLAGYKIYWGTSTRTGTKPSDAGNGGYANVIDAGNVTTYRVDIPDTGTAYFSITAYDNASPNNESNFSSQVSKTPGDVTKDGTVNIFDYNYLKEQFGANNCGNQADIDLDCNVNIFDYNTLKGNFGARA